MNNSQFMYELTGKIADMSIDFVTGKTKLLLELNEKQSAMNLYDNYHEEEKLSITIGKHREKRSREANNYMWLLCGKLAEALSDTKVKHTKEDIYRKAIKEIGVWIDDEVEPEKVKWRCAAWERLGTGWITERVDFTQDGNREIIRFYYGSSQYNTKQMSRLISNIVQDCEAVGIDVRTPEEIANMLSLWRAGE